MTSCAPISNFPQGSDSTFVAALCQDSDIDGRMDDYFPFDNVLQASYLIMDKSKSSPAELKT